MEVLSLYKKKKILLNEYFKFGSSLGSGSFATVILVDDLKENHKKYAMKVIEKKLIKGNEKLIFREISILRKLDHRNIIKLYDVLESKDKIYLQTEYAEGGELFDRIVELGYYTEDMARQTIASLLDALNYLHSQDIIHRDLKPENLLLVSKESNVDIKVADFGLANFDHNMLLKTSCGTLTYAAPEILRNEKYGKPVDLWAVGIITYILLSGYPPFGGETEAELYEAALHGIYKFFSPEWDDISDNAKDFITSLLNLNPNKRMTVKQAMVHPWIKEVQENTTNLQISENIKKNFNAKQKFKVTNNLIICHIIKIKLKFLMKLMDK